MSKKKPCSCGDRAPDGNHRNQVGMGGTGEDQRGGMGEVLPKPASAQLVVKCRKRDSLSLEGMQVRDDERERPDDESRCAEEVGSD